MQDAASDQIMRDLRLHAEVEDLEFRNDPALTHGLGQPRIVSGLFTDGWVAKFMDPSVREARSGFAMPSRSSTSARCPKSLMHTSARRDRDDDAWHSVSNGGDDFALLLEQTGRIPVFVPCVQMHARRTQVDRAPDVRGNLIGLFRNEHVVALPRYQVRRGERDDERLHRCLYAPGVAIISDGETGLSMRSWGTT